MLVAAMLVLLGCTRSSSAGTIAATATLPGPAIRTDQAPDAEAAVENYLALWQGEDYEGMYALLSESARQSVPFEEFQASYQEFATIGAITGLDYQIVSSLVQPSRAQVRYRLTYRSAAVGEFVRETWLDLQRNAEDWRVDWNRRSILPELTDQVSLDLNLVTPSRGNIYDRNGLALAAQGDIVALWIVPNQIGDEDAEGAMLTALGRLLDRHPDSIQAMYDDIRSTDWRVVLGEVSRSEFEEYSGVLGSVGGVQSFQYQGRHYLDRGLAPHAVGYVSQITAESLDFYLQLGYPQDAFVGQIGLEAAFESELRGTPGGSLRIVDSQGLAHEIASRPSEPAYAVYANLDRELQRMTRDAISGLTGAAVVLERDTGAVLAMASSPDFDPNLFDWHNPNSGEGLNQLAQRNQPLINRSTTGVYPLGSLFKPVTMAAALESGLFQADTIYNCGHFWDDLGITLYDWTWEKELPAQGEISLVQALVRSCNPYFYEIGLTLFTNDLPDAITEMARGFGLGEEAGIEIDETDGQVPGPQSVQAVLAEDWAARHMVNLSIGQSYLQATPLQAARYVAALGNGGTLYRPQLVNRIENELGDVLLTFSPEEQGQLPISQSTLEAIQQGMVGVVRHDRGTARRRFLGLNINIAGKTGTAQSGEFSDPHAWFGGYTFEGREGKPDIAVVVLIENGGEGSEVAAPVFRRIIEAYYFGRPISLYPWESQIGVEATETPEDEEGGENGTPEPGQ